MGSDNQILIERHGAITLFDIKGDVTSGSESFFNDACSNLNFQDANKLLLVFDENAYINSGGIAVLIQLLSETHRNNQTVGIAGLSDHFKKIFRMVGITKFAKIYSEVDEAMKSLSES
jgi:anti-anti-sigma factor